MQHFQKTVYESDRLGLIAIDSVAYRIQPASSYLKFDIIRTGGGGLNHSRCNSYHPWLEASFSYVYQGEGQFLQE